MKQPPIFAALSAILLVSCALPAKEDSRVAVVAAPYLQISPDRRILVNGEPARTSNDLYSFRLKQSGDEIHLMTFRDGLLTLKNGQWASYPALPKTPVTGGPRQVENLTATSNAIYFVSKARLYQLDRSSGKIAELDISGVRGGSRLSAVTVFRGTLFLGTTFNGVYRKTSSNFIPDRDNLPRQLYSWNEYFYDEVRDFFIADGRLFLLTDRTGKVFEWKTSSWAPVQQESPIRDLWTDEARAQTWLFGSNSVWQVSVNESNASTLRPAGADGLEAPTLANETIFDGKRLRGFAFPRTVFPHKKLQPPPEATNIRALFVNLDFLRQQDMDAILQFFEKKWVNSVVINFKDDTGNLIYGSELPEAKAIGSSMIHPKLGWFTKAIQKYRPYTIARVVAFKDYRLHKYKDGAYAIWDPGKNAPWRINDIEYWVDPYADFTWNYIISVAKEIDRRHAEWGVNEIQFDYIRLPSDGAVANAVFRHKKPNFEKYEVLETILDRISTNLSVPYSLDIYGYNAIYRMGNIIGQDIETISKYAPIICPMFYPSHFGGSYLNDGSSAQEYNILKFAVDRAKTISYEGTVIRPYLQAFSYQVKNYDYPYVENQIRASRESLADGYGFWNPVPDYAALCEFFSKFKVR
ncbi:MAG: hypothetical protein JNM63_20120 [Spirochaetia bacterium]|nr:hypothetical protein [Spirochaetia bacterium]